MREKVKMALRVVTTAYDDEIDLLIAAAKQDLGIAGVVLPAELDEIAQMAIITYCRVHFGSPYDYEYARLKASYDEQKAQLMTATGYTVWTEATSST